MKRANGAVSNQRQLAAMLLSLLLLLCCHHLELVTPRQPRAPVRVQPQVGDAEAPEVIIQENNIMEEYIAVPDLQDVVGQTGGQQPLLGGVGEQPRGAQAPHTRG